MKCGQSDAVFECHMAYDLISTGSSILPLPAIEHKLIRSDDAPVGFLAGVFNAFFDDFQSFGETQVVD